MLQDHSLKTGQLMSLVDKKRCWRCKETKSISDFHKNKSNRDGLCGLCKKCNYAGVLKWHTNNRERSAAQAKKYYYRIKNDPHHVSVREGYAVSLNCRYRVAKYQAGVRGKEFLLTIEEYGKFLELPCCYCNGALGTVTKGIGLDRVDNSIGYVVGNCVPCCQTCNSVKGHRFTAEETKIMITSLLEFRNKKILIAV